MSWAQRVCSLLWLNVLHLSIKCAEVLLLLLQPFSQLSFWKENNTSITLLLFCSLLLELLLLDTSVSQQVTLIRRMEIVEKQPLLLSVLFFFWFLNASQVAYSSAKKSSSLVTILILSLLLDLKECGELSSSALHFQFSNKSNAQMLYATKVILRIQNKHFHN